jgi:hypothetical protein
MQDPFQLIVEASLFTRVSESQPPPKGTEAAFPHLNESNHTELLLEFIGYLEIPFDIAYYIVAQLNPHRNPHSAKVDTATFYTLSLVSQSFNAAAIPVLYSSIIVSGMTVPRLASTARSNPSLLSHTHTLCFTKPGPVQWDAVAQIVCASPKLRRFLWLHQELGLMKISMIHGHHTYLTDIVFPDNTLDSLAFSYAHTFPQVERAVLREVKFDVPSVVDLLIQMPRLSHLISNNRTLPSEERSESHIKGLATVVRLTNLRKITIVLSKTPSASDSLEFVTKLRTLIPDDRQDVEVGFLQRPPFRPWGVELIEDWIIDGTVWG